MTRRRMMQTTGVVVGAAAIGVAPAAAQTDVSADSLNYGSDYVNDPRINASVTVDLHESAFDELDYTADDGSITSLRESGIVLSEGEDDAPNNPVTLSATSFRTTREDENGNTQVDRFDEYAAFPRGISHDDSDSNTAETAVSALDAEHWSVDNSASTGTLSVSDASHGALKFDVPSQTTGDVATATFDLSTVGSADGTITSGVARKFLQLVTDVNTLSSGVTVEFALLDSTGGESVATFDPAGDASTTSVMVTGTGDAQVAQVRVGELSGSLSDIQAVEVRVKDAAASFDLHALNVEREQIWTFGTKEVLDEDDNVTTEEIESPSGDYSIRSLGTLSGPFASAGIVDVTYDVEQRASELPSEQVHVRRKDTPETYSQPIELEVVHEFEAPTAYALKNVTYANVVDEVGMAQSRYLGVQVATGVSDIEDFDDVENSVTWTNRGSRYSSVGEEVELLSSVSASDRTATRFRVALANSEFNTATAGQSAAAAAAAAAGGSGSFSWLPTISLGFLGGLLFWFRKTIFGGLGR